MLHRQAHWTMIGYVSFLMVIMVLSALSKTTKVQAQVADIGAVEEVSGNAQIERDQSYEVVTDFGIQSYDKAQTEQGRMGIRFVDDTTIKITEHSEVVIPN